MYRKNSINDLNWKQVVVIAIFTLLVWQLTITSAFAQADTAQIFGHVFAGDDQVTVVIGAGIELLAEDDSVIDIAITDDRGQYHFTVDAGSYLIRNSVNDDILPVTVASQMVMVGMDFYNADSTDATIGLLNSVQMSQIFGHVFAGDTIEERVAGVGINLLYSNGTLVESTVTDENGAYNFEVVPGSYFIQNEVNDAILPVSVEPQMVMIGMDFYNSGQAEAAGLVVGAATSQIVGRMYAGHDEGTLVINSPIELLTESGIPVIDVNGEPIVVKTSGNGGYLFNVAPGTYTLRNTLNGQLLPVTVEDGTTVVNVDFYNAATSSVSDVPLAVSLNNVGTNVSTVSISLIIVTALFGIATLPMLSKENKDA